MGIIFIAIGVIILRAIYKSSLTPTDQDFDFENMQKYSWLIMNPGLRTVLKIGGWVLIIIGIVSFFS